MRMALGVCLAAALLAATGLAYEVEVAIAYADGTTELRKSTLAEKNGACSWRLDRASLKAPLKSVKVTPDFARARFGEAGYFVYPTGERGFFTERKPMSKRMSAQSMLMPVYGMKTPGLAFVAIAKGMAYHAGVEVRVGNGTYAVAFDFHSDMDNVYEDLEIEYRIFRSPAAGYSEMARAYREYQLKRGAFRPLAERAKERAELDYAARCPEIRIRQAWKPVPSPVTNQVDRNEPPVKAVVPFARVAELARACKAAGVERAEFCLVGWNRGGHDGAYPQLFPVEPSLGGEAALRQCVKDVQALGYQIVAHGNHRDAYMIADCWDAEYINERRADGSLKPPKVTWGGGGKYTICAQRAYERFAVKDAAMVATLGFRGLYYLDVTTCHQPYTCRDPRHPMTRRQCAEWENLILDIQTATFGGCASEGAADAYIAHYDSALTVCWAKPFAQRPAKDLVQDYVPFWQLVYHGVVLSTPFRNIMNSTANPDPRYTLKLAEFGGRPTFYVHSRFQSDNNASMGDRDLRAVTVEDLAYAVRCIKAGSDEYAPRSHLQFFYMDRHEKVAEGVYRTIYSNGESIVVNYCNGPVEVCGTEIPALGMRILPKTAQK